KGAWRLPTRLDLCSGRVFLCLDLGICAGDPGGARMMQNYKHDVSPDWGLATQMVHGGLTRSQHAETAEAIYMTSGYVYASAEEAQAAFDNSRPRFVYGRFGNPTVAMFEERMALLEGAE